MAEGGEHNNQKRELFRGLGSIIKAGKEALTGDIALDGQPENQAAEVRPSLTRREFLDQTGNATAKIAVGLGLVAVAGGGVVLATKAGVKQGMATEGGQKAVNPAGPTPSPAEIATREAELIKQGAKSSADTLKGASRAPLTIEQQRQQAVKNDYAYYYGTDNQVDWTANTFVHFFQIGSPSPALLTVVYGPGWWGIPSLRPELEYLLGRKISDEELNKIRGNVVDPAIAGDEGMAIKVLRELHSKGKINKEALDFYLMSPAEREKVVRMKYPLSLPAE